MSRFVSIPLDRIIADTELPGDLYLFVSGHFLKYKSGGDRLGLEKYNEFNMKKLQFVFITDDQVENYDAWYERFVSKEKEDLVKRAGEELRPFVDDRAEIKDYMTRVFSSELTDENCIKIQAKTRQFVEAMSKNNLVQRGLAKLMTSSRSLADHSVNVATLSLYTAFHLGYNHQIILENIYYGALFHDYGKTRIDPAVFEGQDPSLVEYAMKDHPVLGAEALKGRFGISEEVLMIISQHHEKHDGTGHPKQLRGNRIYELAKIISVINIFDHLVSKSKALTLKEKQEEALKELVLLNETYFDPKKFVKVLNVLQKAI